MNPRRLLPYLGIALAVAVLFAVLGRVTAPRVGDGSEYYAMFEAWRETFRPWMTPRAFEAYQRLFASGQIPSLVTTKELADMFPALRLPANADFNHFWAYSLLAAMLSKLAGVVGLAPAAPATFLLLHAVLLFAAAAVALHFHGWRGLVAVAVLTVSSPVWWFLDKVHTELFTFTLTLMAIVLVHGRAYVPAALVLALASTQNPSFALVALFPLAFRAFLERARPYATWEVLALVATAILLLAHPAYYFARFGVPTPQMLAGGAALGNGLSSAYVWLLDLDIGLLPNWPLGVALVALTALAWWRARGAPAAGRHGAYWVFAIGLLLVNLLAHSSTENLNSGATRGVARYALWYVPLAYPLVMYVLEHLRGRAWRWGLALGALALTLPSLRANNPRLPEEFGLPSRLSRLVQTRASWAYNPPPEIFAERYGNLGELIWIRQPLAVVGPDCRKALVFNGNGANVFTPPLCFFDAAKLAPLLKPRAAAAPGSYVWLTAEEATASRFQPQRGTTYQVGLGGNGTGILGPGWSGGEPWGRWSDGPLATLGFACPAQKPEGNTLVVRLKVRPFQVKHVTVEQGGDVLWDGAMKDATELPLKVRLGDCSTVAQVRIHIDPIRSPKELGLSPDPRGLGLAFESFTVE